MSFRRNVFVMVVMVGLMFVSYIVWHTNHSMTISQQPNMFLTQRDPITHRLPCEPKRRVAFLKVHKAASSTFANILKRFGYFRNITFAIPANGSSHFAMFGTLTRALMETTPPNRPPDVLFHHVVYNRTAFASVLPPDMVYVASVRNPVDWFMSAFLYYRYDARVAHTLGIYNQDPLFYMRQYFNSPNKFEYGLPIWRALYRLPYDFGVPVDKFRDEDFIKHYVNTSLDDDFKIVLIAEYFDESLVLFKRYMCWHLKDMFYLPRQVSRRVKPTSLTNDLLQLHRRLAPASYIIYNHFLARFRKQIAREGDDFYPEVQTFKRMLNVVKQFCHGHPHNDSSITFSSRWTGEFRISGLDCFVMNYTRPVRLLAEDQRRAYLLRM